MIVKIAPGFYFYCNPYWNASLSNFGNNKPAIVFLRAFIENNSSLAPIFYTLTPKSTLNIILALIALFSNKKIFKLFMQTYIKKVKNHALSPKPVKAQKKNFK